MKALRRIAGPALCVVLALTHAKDVAANTPEVIGPIHDEGVEAGLIDCGSFQVDDHWTIDYTLRFLLDAEGNRVRLVEQVSGVDVFTNSVTGKSIAGPFHNNTLVDFATDRAVIVGIVFRANTAGEGAVFLDVGRIQFTGDDITFLAGRHQFFGGDNAALCAALE